MYADVRVDVRRRSLFPMGALTILLGCESGGKVAGEPAANASAESGVLLDSGGDELSDCFTVCPAHSATLSFSCLSVVTSLQATGPCLANECNPKGGASCAQSQVTVVSSDPFPYPRPPQARPGADRARRPTVDARGPPRAIVIAVIGAGGTSPARSDGGQPFSDSHRRLLAFQPRRVSAKRSAVGCNRRERRRRRCCRRSRTTSGTGTRLRTERSGKPRQRSIRRTPGNSNALRRGNPRRSHTAARRRREVPSPPGGARWWLRRPRQR